MPEDQNKTQRAAVTFLFWLALVAALTATSVLLDSIAVTGGMIWAPPAIVLARLLTLQEHQTRGPYLAALALGVLAGLISLGVGLTPAALQALVSLISVSVAAWLYERALQGQPPHFDEASYMHFAVLIVLPAAIIGALAGAALSFVLDGAAFETAFSNWLIYLGIGLLAGTPLALWGFSDPETRFAVSAREAIWTAAAALCLMLVLAAGLVFPQNVMSLILPLLLIPLCALRSGRVGIMLLTVVGTLGLALTGPGSADLSDAAWPSASAVSFAILFLCAVLPGNLIAAQLGRMETAAAKQQLRIGSQVQHLSALSHEIKTPLNAIHGMFQLLDRSDLNDRQRRWSDAGLSASRNLQVQVSQMLDMAQLDEQTIRIRPEPVDPRKLMKTWVVALEADIALSGKAIRAGGTVAREVPETLVLDPSRVQQILMNLLTNAVKFTADGAIDIRMRATEDSATISVSDTGIGLEEVAQRAVFDRYWQAEGNRQGGAGLGLAISQDLAARMGGALSLQSTPGKGSTFILTLPLQPVVMTGSQA